MLHVKNTSIETRLFSKELGQCNKENASPYVEINQKIFRQKNYLFPLLKLNDNLENVGIISPMKCLR